MNDQSADLDQADEDILAATVFFAVTDEALEAAAGREKPAASVYDLSFNLLYDCKC